MTFILSFSCAPPCNFFITWYDGHLNRNSQWPLFSRLCWDTQLLKQLAHTMKLIKLYCSYIWPNKTALSQQDLLGLKTDLEHKCFGTFSIRITVIMLDLNRTVMDPVLVVVKHFKLKRKEDQLSWLNYQITSPGFSRVCLMGYSLTSTINTEKET